MRRRIPPLRATLGVKLALALFAAVALALAIVYLMVVPRLENRLVDAKIDDLAGTARPFVAEIGEGLAAGPVELNDRVEFAAESLSARVVVFRRFGSDGAIPVDDSSPLRPAEVRDDPIVRRAVESGALATGRVERADRDIGEVAVPLGRDYVVLVAAPLDDALATVGLVRRSLVAAGLVALLMTAVAAYVAALGLTRRLRRLEVAADRIAAGDFSQPVASGGADEIAELARAFDAMRIRLADLDRVRREFIANASHELRTPLFSLGGFLELLDDEDLDPATSREFLSETRAQVERLTRLATDLLDLSRLDAGQLEVERGEVDLAAAARIVADEFRALAEATDHPLELRGADDAPAVGDHERIVQIGRILVENALRHTPAGTRIEVGAAVDDGRATLSVDDEGPGIPAEDQEHVFQRFYRAGGGKASGSGLGLAIASELAARMGGSLRMSSAPGRTSFVLALPARPAAFSRENGALPERALAGSGESQRT